MSDLLINLTKEQEEFIDAMFNWMKCDTDGDEVSKLYDEILEINKVIDAWKE